MQVSQKEPFSSEDFLRPQIGLLRLPVAEQMRWVGGRPVWGGERMWVGWGQLALVCVLIDREQGEEQLLSTWWWVSSMPVLATVLRQSLGQLECCWSGQVKVRT